jgi:S-adenosylhomocysteine hydrolase
MLTITAKIVEGHESIFRQFDYIIVQHLKQDTLEFVECLLRSGCNISKIYGISYSVDQGSLDSLRNLKLNVEVPPFAELSVRLRKLFEERDGPAVILDVGGYGSAVALRSELAQKVRFVVEDTNHGLWQYQSIRPRCPIIEVASIENKSVENAYVGRRIVDGVEQFFKEGGIAIPSDGYVVVGFGGIGRSVCSALALKGINAGVAEVDERKLAIAEAFGHKVGKSIGEFVDAKVIIGCSGKSSVNHDHLAGLRVGPFLISGSSKKVEFEDVIIQGKILESKIKNASIEKITGAIIVNNGEPINLHYGSLNEETSDFMFANIASAIIEGASSHEAGIYGLSDERQRGICALWWTHYRSQG